jgi:hypothetical protein
MDVDHLAEISDDPDDGDSDYGRGWQAAGRTARAGYEQAVSTLLDVAQRTGSPAAQWAAGYLVADPDRLAPERPAPGEPTTLGPIHITSDAMDAIRAQAARMWPPHLGRYPGGQATPGPSGGAEDDCREATLEAEGRFWAEPAPAGEYETAAPVVPQASEAQRAAEGDGWRVDEYRDDCHRDTDGQPTTYWRHGLAASWWSLADPTGPAYATLDGLRAAHPGLTPVAVDNVAALLADRDRLAREVETWQAKAHKAWEDGDRDALERVIRLRENARLAVTIQRYQPVIDAAKAWRAQFTRPIDTKLPRQGALIAAVDALDDVGTSQPAPYCDLHGCNRGLTPMTAEPLWWLSFCDPDIAASIPEPARQPGGPSFLGVIIVQASDLPAAITRSHLLGINPGGEIGVAGPLPEWSVAAEWRDRLLTAAEADAIPDPSMRECGE